MPSRISIRIDVTNMCTDFTFRKVDSFDKALDLSLPVGPGEGDLFLVPVGTWILVEQKLISQMVEWRELSKYNFFARFPPSIDSFMGYLTTHSIGRKDTILFMLYSNHKGFLGHIGLTKVSNQHAEIDAVMVDPTVHGQGLAAKALSALILWAENSIGINVLSLDVLSNNEPAIRLYSKSGFIVFSEIGLKTRGSSDFMQLVDCEAGEESMGLSRIRMVRNSEHL